jgi:hypothetical protein
MVPPCQELYGCWLKPRPQILRWRLRSRYFGMLCMTVRRRQLSRELEIRVIWCAYTDA